MDCVCYKNIIFYQGNFYTEKENIKSSLLDNRLEKIFTSLDIETAKFTDIPILYDKGILLLHSFHWNIAHMLWDHMYPSWYGLYLNYTDLSDKIDFQWLTIADIDDIHVYTHKNIIEQFSGNLLYSLKLFSCKYEKPIIIPWLITGLKGIGIGCVDKKLHTEKGTMINNLDPIETFVNRFYTKYNIERNTLLNKEHLKTCNNIIFIVNKRKYEGITHFFGKMNNKYLGKYNFKIINYGDYNFKEQLQILNTSCLCIVGIGTARANTPFLPNGSIEIQTFEPDIQNKNYIKYVDYHIGTLSNYVKIINIPYYTKDEAMMSRYSELLEEYIVKALTELPCEVPVFVNSNIPLEIIILKEHTKYDIMYEKWRNNLSNQIEDLIELLNN